LFTVTIPLFAGLIGLLFSVMALFNLIRDSFDSDIVRVIIAIFVFIIVQVSSLKAINVLCEKIVLSYKEMELTKRQEKSIAFFVIPINVVLTLWAMISIMNADQYGGFFFYLFAIFSIPSTGILLIEKVTGKSILA
jgi:hypothetical protein